MLVFLQIILSSIALALVSEFVVIVAAKSTAAGLATKLASLAVLGLTAEGQRFTEFVLFLLIGLLVYFAARSLIQYEINPPKNTHVHDIDNLTSGGGG